MPFGVYHTDRIADTVVFDSVGITGATRQTGIAAGLSIFTWFCQIGAVIMGKRVGRKTILLVMWPTLLLALIGLTVSGCVSIKDRIIRTGTCADLCAVLCSPRLVKTILTRESPRE